MTYFFIYTMWRLQCNQSSYFWLAKRLKEQRTNALRNCRNSNIMLKKHWALGNNRGYKIKVIKPPLQGQQNDSFNGKTWRAKFWKPLYRSNTSWANLILLWKPNRCRGILKLGKLRHKSLKGTLMQIWKTAYCFMFRLKQYPENFAFLILETLELFACKVWKFAKK